MSTELQYKKKRSVVHEHFQCIDDAQASKCNICNIHIESPNSNMTNLRHHLSSNMCPTSPKCYKRKESRKKYKKVTGKECGENYRVLSTAYFNKWVESSSRPGAVCCVHSMDQIIRC